MKKIQLILLSLLFAGAIQAQKVRGMVADQKHQPLIGATILELGTQNGVVADADGKFELSLSKREASLVISYTGYLSDTVAVDISRPMHIMLSEDSKELDQIVITASSTFLDDLESVHVEVITEAELGKAACCNLSESFETNASVDVSLPMR